MLVRPMKVVAARAVFAILVCAAGQVAISAQNLDTHGMPSQQQLSTPEYLKTVLIKVTKREYDIKKLVSAPSLSPEAKVGQALWQQRCGYCHDGMGQPTYKTMGSWIDSDMVKDLGADTVKAFISNGVDRMPAFKYGLDDKQINAIVEFLKTVSPKLKPTAAQLAGKLDGPGSNAE